MGLYEKIGNEMRAALKEGDSVKLSTLRMLISAIKIAIIEKNSKDIDDAEVIQILQRQIKQRRESIEQFEKGKRQDLAEKELKELHILEAYMPQQMSEDELTVIVKEAISQTAAVNKSDMGKVMKAVMDKARGRCDGKLVNQIVMKFLK